MTRFRVNTGWKRLFTELYLVTKQFQTSKEADNFAHVGTMVTPSCICLCLHMQNFLERHHKLCQNQCLRVVHNDPGE